MNPRVSLLFIITTIATITTVFSADARDRHSLRHHVASAVSCTYTNEGRVVCPEAVPTYGQAAPGRSWLMLSARRHPTNTPAGHGLVTVPTAAGIDITVDADFAPKIQPFIAALVARGYHPRQIHCHATERHVRGSFHYQGRACDFDQRGWGLTAKIMYHVRSLAESFGLRDGGEFRDWGHIDDGPHLHRHYRRYAR